MGTSSSLSASKRQLKEAGAAYNQFMETASRWCSQTHAVMDNLANGDGRLLAELDAAMSKGVATIRKARVDDPILVALVAWSASVSLSIDRLASAPSHIPTSPRIRQLAGPLRMHGLHLANCGRIQQGISLLTEAVTVLTQPPTHDNALQRADCIKILAVLLKTAGKTHEAEVLLLGAMAADAHAGCRIENHPSFHASLLAELYLDTARTEEALATGLAAEKAMLKADGTASPATACACSSCWRTFTTPWARKATMPCSTS